MNDIERREIQVAISADFVFDGFLADVLVQSKICEAKSQYDEAIRQVTVIRGELTINFVVNNCKQIIKKT